MKTYDEIIDKIKQYKKEDNLSDITISKAKLWVYLSCALGLSTDAFTSEDHISVVPVHKETQLSMEIGIEDYRIDSVSVEKGFGLQFDTLYDAEYPEEVTVAKILFNLAKGQFQID